MKKKLGIAAASLVIAATAFGAGTASAGGAVDNEHANYGKSADALRAVLRGAAQNTPANDVLIELWAAHA